MKIYSFKREFIVLQTHHSNPGLDPGYSEPSEHLDSGSSPGMTKVLTPDLHIIV